MIMPGYTHLQQAQPIRFAHWLLSYGWMLQRDRERLVDLTRLVDVLPLGSAALAGAGLGFLWFNTYPAQIFMGDIGALAVGAALLHAERTTSLSRGMAPGSNSRASNRSAGPSASEAVRTRCEVSGSSASCTACPA